MYLVDTNVLVYAIDVSEPAKRERAQSVLRVLGDRQLGALSAQVLSEFFTVVTRRIASPLSAEEAERRITNLARSWAVHEISAVTVIEAIRAARIHQLSYWDGLIWSAAKLNGIRDILSEDFSHGRLIEGVRVSDPFNAEFELEALGRERR